MVPRQRGQRLRCSPSGRSPQTYFGFHPLIMRKVRVSGTTRRKFSLTRPYLRQSSQKECPQGSLTGLVHSPRHMPHSVAFAFIFNTRLLLRSGNHRRPMPIRPASRCDSVPSRFLYKRGDERCFECTAGRALCPSPVRTGKVGPSSALRALRRLLPCEYLSY